VYQEFLSESEELLDRLRVDVASLEDEFHRGGDIDPDLVNGLFRSAHSLKGLSAMFGIDGLTDLAHHFEDLLASVRVDKLTVGDALLRLISETVDLFGTYLASLGDASEDVCADDAVSNMIGRLENVLEDAKVQERQCLPKLQLDPEILSVLTEYEEHRLRENIQKGKDILLIEVAFEILSFDEGLSRLTNSIREAGELISTLPARGVSADSQIRFLLLVATSLDAPDLVRHVSCPNSSITSVLEKVPSSPMALGSVVAQESSQAQAVQAQGFESEPGRKVFKLLDSSVAVSQSTGDQGEHVLLPKEKRELGSLRSISETVRVDIRKLDKLMNLVGELAMRQGSVGQIARALIGEESTLKSGEELEKIDEDLHRRLREIQSSVLELRLVPLRQILEKLSRIVRKLNLESEKDVTLELRGIDTELDKLMLEKLADPLVHIVRNSFDHGIEKNDERVALGKEPNGLITIDAFQRGNHVVIEVTDDGRGIDLEAIRARAEQMGMIPSDRTTSEKELLEHVFDPGLSTSLKVTETSGRGVGMDVVRENVKEMGGLASIRSTRGEGTTVSITVPVTLAIVQSLIVGVCDQYFAIPLNPVVETLFVSPSEIRHCDGHEVMSLRGEMLLLRRLRDEFNLHGSALGDDIYIVVVAVGEQSLGLIVDRLYGQRDTVLRPIRGPVPEIRGISGATEITTYGAVLVLDIASIIEDQMHKRNART